MMKEKTLGQELVAAVKEALHTKGKGNIVRPKINIAYVRARIDTNTKERAADALESISDTIR